MTTNYNPPKSIYDESQNYNPRSVELFPTDALVEDDVVNDTVAVPYANEPDEKPTPVYIVSKNEFKFKTTGYYTHTFTGIDQVVQIVPNEYRARYIKITNPSSFSILIGSSDTMQVPTSYEMDPGQTIEVTGTNAIYAKSTNAGGGKVSWLVEKEYDH